MNDSKPSRNNPISGALYFVRGLSLIFGGGVKRYVAIPLFINTILFGGLIYYGWGNLGELQAYVEREWLHEWLQFLSWFLVPLFMVTAAIVTFFGFAVLGNLIAAPFNGLLAEAVERKLGGTAPGAGIGWGRLVRDLVRSLYSEVRKLLYFLLWMVPLLILFLIPVVNIAAPFLLVAFSAWMLTVEYADFPMGNHGINFPRQRKILAGKRLLSLGFGGAATMALMVPGLNFLVIPTAVAGATAMWVEQLSDASKH